MTFSDFILGVVIGCTNFPDALPLATLLVDVKLDEHNVHFYRLNSDGAMNQCLSGMFTSNYSTFRHNRGYEGGSG